MVVCDGLKGLPDAIATVWPQAITQTCVVHLMRASFRYAARQDWDKISRALKPIYTAPTAQAAGQSLPLVFELWPAGWQVPSGHQLKLELTQGDAPTWRPDNETSRLELSGLQLTVPVRPS
jgi:predicted acyl esterase